MLPTSLFVKFRQKIERVLPLIYFTELCSAGEYSLTGFAPCDAAPRGTYVEGTGKTTYTACPTGTTTVTYGAKSRYDCGSKIISFALVMTGHINHMYIRDILKNIC